MRIFKRILLVLLAGLVIVAGIQYKLVFYGISQLKGQLKIIWNTVPVAEVISDPHTPAKVKEKLLLISSIKKFAVDSLGLLPTENYTTFYDQHDKPVLWVLTGCRPFAFEAKTWWFPFLGNVSYKGFFKKENGEKELKELINSGYDADLSATGGWSTLGWFKDPVLSNMLKKSDGVLAELIIHELTHGTIYLKSNVDFNENLATFIGEQGAVDFLKAGNNKDSALLIYYHQYKADESIYGDYLLTAQKRLDSLYRNFKDDLSQDEKSEAKKNLIRSVVLGIERLPLNHKERYIFNLQKNRLPNNTYFMSNNRYRKSQQKMESVFKIKFDNNLKSFINWVKESNQEEVIRQLSD